MYLTKRTHKKQSILSYTLLFILLPLFSIILFKIFHTGFKDLKILLSVNIDCHRIAASLRVSHLSKNTTIRACNSLDRTVRAVDIPLLIHCNVSIRTTILCRNLSICKQFIKPFFTCNKSSFSMRCRICIHASKLGFCKPR